MSSTPEQPSPIRRLFLNAEGLRPGWGLALFSLPPVSLYVFGRVVAHYFPLLIPKPTGPVTMRPLLTFASEALTFVLLALLTLILSLLERRPFARYGLALPRAMPDFARGLAWGFAMLSLLIAALYFTHTIAFHGLALHGFQPFTSALEWLAAFLFVGLFEEFFFRGLPSVHPSPEPSKPFSLRPPPFGPPPPSSLSASSPGLTPVTAAKRPGASSPLHSPVSPSPSPFTAPAPSGGPSASTLRGTGPNPFSTARRIPETLPPGTC